MASIRKVNSGSPKKLKRPGVSLYIADFRDETGCRRQECHHLTAREARKLEAELTLLE
ncbi:MAG: hypothetical protein IIA61_13540 [Candidatus Marinimicrobia bacterium]|nr:hypothetical protein [Candidatus Neomarinimicrobiota bacterium]